MLSVRGVALNFGGVVALDDISLDIRAGSITALIGPNGAGKTTLFNVMSGFIAPRRGHVLLEGAEITGLPPHRVFERGLVRTFQVPAVFERMTVIDNLLTVPLHQRGERLLTSLVRPRLVAEQERTLRARAEQVVAFLDLAPVRDKYAGQLSGGQKKLLELGRVMMAEPRVVLLDEPGAGVNPTLMGRLTESLRRLNRDHGYTFCVIEHDMDLIASLCESVIVMAEGRVLTQGSMADVRADPTVREAYLGRADGARTATHRPVA
jgi:branched-chain amino acid transport system ATP-binding protein